MKELRIKFNYRKREAKIVADTFSRLLMTHHKSCLPHNIIEKDVCELLCLDDIFVNEASNCFPIATEETVFSLVTQIVEAERKLELK